MKNKCIDILILLCLLPGISAEGILTAKNIDAQLTIKGSFDIVPITNDFSLKYINTNLTFVPQESNHQHIVNLETTPLSEIKDNSILFRWEKPANSNYEFSVVSTIALTYYRTKVNMPIRFPLTNISEEIARYTESSKTIDSDNPSIIMQANSLAEGEDNLYIVVGKLAEWTKNTVEYNLSTATESVSEKASWVLQNKKGVCDEITNLFIAMCRSLGIPARFISGVAYTESELFTERWGPHGWAEVYFPGYGWVDYDVTYGEFGFIDTAHIKLKDSIDPDESSTRYNWLGYGAEVRAKSLETPVVLNSYDGKVNSNIKLAIEPEINEIGFNSYNLITVTIKNDNNYYVADDITISKVNLLQMEDSQTKTVFLEPYEEKKLSWIINVGELERDYMYTFPIAVFDFYNTTVQASFASRYGAPVYTRDEMLAIKDTKEEKSSKASTKEIRLECKPNKEFFYIYENNTIECLVKNIGNSYVANLEICTDSCKRVDLGISQQKKVTFPLLATQGGPRDSIITVKDSGSVKNIAVSYTVLDKPNVIIEDIHIPANVNYSDMFTLEFTVKKISSSMPKNIEITVKKENYEKKWNIDTLQENKKFIITMQANMLNEGNNSYEIQAQYMDALGNIYKEDKTINTQLTNLTVMQKITVWIQTVIRKIAGT